MSEKLSALIDGELSEHEQRQLLRDMMADETLQRAWGRYHVIRAALRAEEHEIPAADVAARVRAALVAEPRISTDAQGKPAISGRALKFAGSVAIAATIAAVTIIGLQSVFGPTTPSAQLAEAPAKNPPRAVLTARWERQKRETEQVLNTYLVEHNEFAPANGVSGMLGSNVRVVAYESKP